MYAHKLSRMLKTHADARPASQSTVRIVHGSNMYCQTNGPILTGSARPSKSITVFDVDATEQDETAETLDEMKGRRTATDIRNPFTKQAFFRPITTA
jgi:hypothetical protein